jgi:hypothetical protein
VQIHGPGGCVDGSAIEVSINGGKEDQHPFVTVQFPTGVRFYLDAGDADVLIKVFCQAKDMLAAHRSAVANHAGIGEYVHEPAHVAEAEAANAAQAAADDDVLCAAVTAGRFGGEYACTEPKGHEPSDHVAMGGDMECARWPAVKGLPVLDDDGGDGDDEPEPERTATPAEHADTAERIERARTSVARPVPGTGALHSRTFGDLDGGDDADTAAGALQADIDAAVAAPINPAYVNTGLPKPGTQA